MKFAKFKNFESFLEGILPAEQSICVRLRALIQENFPELTEKFAYGVPFYHGNSRVCFMYPASLPYSGIDAGVSFGLNRGYLLSNEQGLLDLGGRKEVAYIRLLREREIQQDSFLEILHEAVLLDAAFTLWKETLNRRKLSCFYQRIACFDP